jgi:hypothetical protein
MKPKDILPDEIDSVEKGGVLIRKGTIGAFTENIKLIESTSAMNEQSEDFKNAVTDLLSLIPALQQLKFFEFYSVKSVKVRTIIRNAFPKLPLGD